MQKWSTTGSCGLQLHCALVIRFGKSRYNKRESLTLWGRMYEIERKSQCHFCVLRYFKKEFFFWNNIFEKRLSKYIRFKAMEKHAP